MVARDCVGDVTLHSAHGGSVTAVMHVQGVQWASSAARVEAVLGRRPGVVAVNAVMLRRLRLPAPHDAGEPIATSGSPTVPASATTPAG